MLALFSPHGENLGHIQTKVTEASISDVVVEGGGILHPWIT
jgi:hypothetical protein